MTGHFIGALMCHFMCQLDDQLFLSHLFIQKNLATDDNADSALSSSLDRVLMADLECDMHSETYEYDDPSEIKRF